MYLDDYLDACEFHAYGALPADKWVDRRY